MKQTTITAVLTEIIGNKRKKTAQYRSLSFISWQENASKMHGKKAEKLRESIEWVITCKKKEANE